MPTLIAIVVSLALTALLMFMWRRRRLAAIAALQRDRDLLSASSAGRAARGSAADSTDEANDD